VHPSGFTEFVFGWPSKPQMSVFEHFVYRITPGYIPFVIADWEGSYAVSHVTLR
jgi:hypothetical protein